jgi:hypothetical protein
MLIFTCFAESSLCTAPGLCVLGSPFPFEGKGLQFLNISACTRQMVDDAEHVMLSWCRHYEQELIDASYKRSALPRHLLDRFDSARGALIDSIQMLLNMADLCTIYLRFLEPCCMLSFYGDKADLARQSTALRKDASFLKPFEGALTIAKLRPRLFLSLDMQKAQVSSPWGGCACLKDWPRLH